MEIKTAVGYTKNIRCADAHTESRAEYILPDYLGDMKKLLYTSASVRPASKTVDGDRVECSGIVVYSLIYLDSEDNLSSAELSSDYDFSVKCSPGKCRDSMVDTRLSGYSVRLSGPRKISAKSSVTGSVRLIEDEEFALSGDGAIDRNDREFATRMLKIRHTELSTALEREYAESVAKLEGAIAEEVSVIYCDEAVSADSAVLDEGGVTVKGRLRLCALVQNGDSEPIRVEKTIAIEETVPFEKADNEMRFIPELTVVSLKPAVNPDSEGCEVVLSAIVEMCVSGEKNDSLEILTDGYLKECASDNKYESFCYSELSDVVALKSAHSARISRSESSAGRLREVLFVSAEPKVDSTSVGDDGIKIVGEIRYSGLSTEVDDEGKICYSPIKSAEQFEIIANISCQNPNNLRIESKIKAQNVDAVIDSDSIIVSCSLEGRAVLSEEKSLTVLSSIEALENEPYEKCGSKITVYYPTEGDTLFSIAKKFHSCVSKIASDNSLTESVMSSDSSNGALSGVRKLMIY